MADITPTPSTPISSPATPTDAPVVAATGETPATSPATPPAAKPDRVGARLAKLSADARAAKEAREAAEARAAAAEDKAAREVQALRQKLISDPVALQELLAEALRGDEPPKPEDIAKSVEEIRAELQARKDQEAAAAKAAEDRKSQEFAGQLIEAAAKAIADEKDADGGPKFDICSRVEDAAATALAVAHAAWTQDGAADIDEAGFRSSYLIPALETLEAHYEDQGRKFSKHPRSNDVTASPTDDKARPATVTNKLNGPGPSKVSFDSSMNPRAALAEVLAAAGVQ